MNQAYIRLLFDPKLENPIFVVGFPGIGNIGRTVARLLIEFSRAKLFAELYSPSFPDYVFIDKKGVCHPPRYEFYASTTGRNLVILTGDSQPPLEDIPAHYEVCSEVVDFAGKLGCSFIITVEGAPSPHPTKDVYVAATSRKQAEEYTRKNALIYKGRSIVGVPGLLLGLAKRRGLEGICLLGSTLGITADRETAFRVYKFLKKVLGTDTQEGL
jgi:proteasome assembly chaperone (PAC2) family protein